MKERPILMDTPSVMGLIDDIKSQTRRMVKHDLSDKMMADPRIRATISKSPLMVHFKVMDGKSREFFCGVVCPYGQPGDVLWVRETLFRDQSGDWCYQAGNDIVMLEEYTAPILLNDAKLVIPTIHMPREACRFRLKIVDVRVERVQDISEDDAIAEGYDRKQLLSWMEEAAGYGLEGYFPDRPLIWYGERWGRLHGRDSWDTNPWVWAISFEQIKEGGARES